MENFEGGPFTEREKVALEYAEMYLVSPKSVTDELFDRLKKQFTESEIVEMSFFIGFNNMYMRFSAAMDLEPVDGENIVVRTLQQQGLPKPRAPLEHVGPPQLHPSRRAGGHGL